MNGGSAGSASTFIGLRVVPGVGAQCPTTAPAGPRIAQFANDKQQPTAGPGVAGRHLAPRNSRAYVDRW